MYDQLVTLINCPISFLVYSLWSNHKKGSGASTQCIPSECSCRWYKCRAKPECLILLSVSSPYQNTGTAVAVEEPHFHLKNQKVCECGMEMATCEGLTQHSAPLLWWWEHKWDIPNPPSNLTLNFTALFTDGLSPQSFYFSHFGKLEATAKPLFRALLAMDLLATPTNFGSGTFTAWLKRGRGRSADRKVPCASTHLPQWLPVFT